MNVKRVNIWAENTESSRKFYTRYFAGRAKRKIKQQGFCDSYDITFRNGLALAVKPKQLVGAIAEVEVAVRAENHLSFQFENKTQVDDLTQWIVDEGFILEKSPSHQSDGCYTSVVRDPDQNIVEIYHID